MSYAQSEFTVDPDVMEAAAERPDFMDVSVREALADIRAVGKTAWTWTMKGRREGKRFYATLGWFEAIKLRTAQTLHSAGVDKAGFGKVLRLKLETQERFLSYVSQMEAAAEKEINLDNVVSAEAFLALAGFKSGALESCEGARLAIR